MPRSEAFRFSGEVFDDHRQQSCTHLDRCRRDGAVQFEQCVHAEDAKQSVSVFGEGKITVPADFKRVEPKSRIIQHEFQAKAGEGDDVKTARVTMMAAGGDVKANIQRWQGQFAGGDQDARKTEEMKVGKWQVYVVDVNGNYAERVGGSLCRRQSRQSGKLCHGRSHSGRSQRTQVLSENDRTSRSGESKSQGVCGYGQRHRQISSGTSLRLPFREGPR